MVEEPKPLKKQAQIEQDEAFARELEAELNKTINWDDKYFNSNVAFLEKTKEQLEEEESRALKRKTESQAEKPSKKQKLDEEGKQHRASCKTKPVSSVSQPLQRLDMDLFGPTFVKSLNKKSYCLVVTDDYRSGTTWLFNIDTLAQLMNYQPVVAGNQPNSSAGIQENHTTGTCGQEAESVQQYVLLPLWSSGSKDPQNTDAVAFEVKDPKSKVHVSPSRSDKTKKHDEKTKREAKGKSLIELFIGVKDLSDDLKELSNNNTNGGHTKEEGIDYEELFDLVARIEAIRLFLAYACFMKIMIYQMDVKRAFLYGTIKEEVYVCQPPGFEDPDYPDKVYKVVKALYGLHQAPRAWYETLANYLLENDLCKAFEKLLKDKFQMSSIGELTFFLVLQVKQKLDGIFISQDKYVAEILRKFGLMDGKSASTPIDTEKPLLKDPDGEDVDVHTYSSMIGSLMYLTSSRPDIMFAVCACAHF
nr:putative ribonuclease H-like domain-containing protein [Tanacetum cinerariifolium]